MENQIKMADGHVLPVVRTRLDIDLPMFSEKKLETPKDVVEFLAPHISNLTREVLMVVCFDIGMFPICVSLVGIGTEYETNMPIKDIMQIGLMANASGIVVMHNHPGVFSDKRELISSMNDNKSTDALIKACQLFEIVLLDSIVISNTREGDKGLPAYYSLREKKVKKLEKLYIDRYEKGFGFLSTTGEFLEWEGTKQANKYWGFDVTKQTSHPQITTYSPEELKQAIELIQSGKLAEWNAKEQTTSDPKQSVFESQEYKELLKRNAERNEALKRQMELGKAIIQQTKEQTDIER